MADTNILRQVAKMQNQWQKYWTIFWQFRRLRLMRLMENRGTFFFWTFISILWMTFNIIFFTSIVQVNRGLSGWTLPEVYLLLSVFTLLDSLMWGWIYHNMSDYTRKVFSGDFSMHLLKPVNPQFLVMTFANSYDQIPRSLAGVLGILYSLHLIGRAVSMGQVLLFVSVLATSFMFIFSLWFLISTLAFWVERLENINDVIPSFNRLWQVPRGVYSGVASTVLTVFLPVALVTSVPAEILIGKSAMNWVLYFIAFTIGLFLFASWFFRFSLRKYSSVGG